MSTVIVLTPIIIAGWPIIAGAVTAAIGSMGFSVVGDQVAARGAVAAKNSVDVELEDSEILQDAVGGEKLVVERDGMRATFSRDGRGALKLCMEGESFSKTELKRVGEELINRVTQQYVYHRVVSELKQRNMTIVDEEVSADRTVKIRVRNV